VHAWNGTLRLGLDLLFEIHLPTWFTEPVATPKVENLFRRWLVIADPTNKARSLLSLGIAADRIRLAGRLEDGIRGLHKPVYQFVDIPAEVP